MVSVGVVNGVACVHGAAVVSSAWSCAVGRLV